MAIEADLYIRSRHHPCRNNWESLGVSVIESSEGGEFDFFYPSILDVRYKEDDEPAIIFADNNARGNIRARFRVPEAECDVEFPIVLEVGEVVEIYSNNKSIDLRHSPVTADK